MDISKKINYAIVFLLSVAFLAFGIFLILNRDYISNPYLNPYYRESTSIFNYNEKLARFRNWGFFYPWNIISYLSFFQTILLGFLIIRKELKMRPIEIIFISVSLLSIFLINDLVILSFYIVVCLLFSTIILFFLKKFKKHRFFLFLNLLTILAWIIFLFVEGWLFLD
jgi:hypothetical protein